MKKDKKIEKSKVFYKLYVVNIVITIVFICLISFLCSTFSSRLILNNFIAFNEDMIAEKVNVLDDRVKHLDETVDLIIGDESTFKFLMTNEKDYEKPTAILKIIRRFRNICSSNSLVRGICLVDLQRQIVITENTKMTIEGNRYDRYQGQNSFVVTNDGEERKLEFVKRFEPIRGKKVVYMILTVDEEVFTSNLLVGKESEMLKSCLMTRQGDVLTADGLDECAPAVQKELQGLEKGTEKFETSGQKLVLYKNPSKVSDMSIAAYEDYTYLEGQTRELKQMIIISSIAMILAASGIIYLCSLQFYRPLKRLGSKARGMNGGSGAGKSMDEYSLIETAIDELQYEKEYAQPYAIRNAAARLVMEEFQQEWMDYLKETLHQPMKFSWYVLMVTECRDNACTGKISGAYQKLIDEEPQINGFFVDMTPYRCVGIFNTELDYEQFLEKAKETKNRLAEEAVSCICCVSQNFKNPENMSLIYTEVLCMLEKAFFKGDAAFVHGEQTQAGTQKDQDRKYGENKLIQYVVSGEAEEAFAQLRNMTKSLEDQAADIQYTRFQYFQICQNLLENVVELGAKIPKDYGEKELFQKIFETRTIQELDALAEEILTCCIGYFQKREKGYSANVEKAMEFIRVNYGKDLSIDDVAASVFLSSGYLSIIFKEETGYTVLDYITAIRMSKAKELVLQGPGLKVKEIAEQLGYNNVQSFIRYFKKYYGETPMAYRKNADGK